MKRLKIPSAEIPLNSQSGDTLKPLTRNFCTQMKTHYRTTAYEQLRRFADEPASRAFILEGFSRGWENPSLSESCSLWRSLLIKVSLGELIRVGEAVAFRYDVEGTMHGQWWRSFWRIRIFVWRLRCTSNRFNPSDVGMIRFRYCGFVFRMLREMHLSFFFIGIRVIFKIFFYKILSRYVIFVLWMINQYSVYV